MGFSRSFRAEVLINAPADRVWHMATDFEAYPEWNPFMPDITLHGKLAAGTKFTATLAPVGRPAREINPTIVAVSPYQYGQPSELHYHGAAAPSFLFHGAHVLRLEPQAGGASVKVVKQEDFGGLLAPFFWRASANRVHEQGVALMLAALKLRADKGVSRSLNRR